MKKLITILFILLSLAGYSQMPDSQAQPFYGTRYFVSLDGQDSLAIWYENDTIKWSSTDSVYIEKLLYEDLTGGADTISDTYIAVGTGTGIEGSPDFTYDGNDFDISD